MGAHEVLDSWVIGQDRLRLRASIKGYPGWVVEVIAVPTGGIAALAELWICPQSYPLRPVKVPGGGIEDHGLAGAVENVPPGGIPARLVRAINAGELLDLATQAAGQLQKAEAAAAAFAAQRRPEFVDYFQHRAATAEALGGAERRRSGRNGNGIDHYLIWATRYVEKLNSVPRVRNPIAELANEYGEKEIYIRDTITDARNRHGLITRPPGRGQAGGNLTEKALALLAERLDKAGDNDHG